MIRERNRILDAATSPARFRQVAERVLDLLFPPHCIVCHSFGEWLCKGCLAQVERICPPICYRCGLPLALGATGCSTSSQEAPTLCRQCAKTRPPLDVVRAYGTYHGPLKRAIQQLKYSDLRALAAPLAALMSEAWSAEPSIYPKTDVIVPVPLHPIRLQERGYNQAALLARELGTRQSLPVIEDVLIRTRATAPQVGLDAQQREANVFGAFHCTTDSLATMRVLLVDDVFTTGSTLKACCAALRDAGVSIVWAYTLARGGPSAEPISTQTKTRRVRNGTHDQGSEL